MAFDGFYYDSVIKLELKFYCIKKNATIQYETKSYKFVEYHKKNVIRIPVYFYYNEPRRIDNFFRPTFDIFRLRNESVKVQKYLCHCEK